MMPRKCLLLAAVFALGACSSGPKSGSEAVESDPSGVWDQDAPPPVSAKGQSEDAPANPNDPYAALQSAIKSQNDDRIRRQAEGILGRSKDDERALNALAMVNYRQGRHELAAYMLGKAIQKNGSASELHSNLGLVELARNNRGAAVKSFRRAIEVNSNDGVASANLGAIYIAEKDYNKAAVVLETSARRGPKDAKTLNNYAVALVATGRADQAERVYEDALKISPNQKELLLNYAIALVDHLGKSKEGLDVINKLKFMGVPAESRDKLSSLENKAKAGVK